MIENVHVDIMLGIARLSIDDHFREVGPKRRWNMVFRTQTKRLS